MSNLPVSRCRNLTVSSKPPKTGLSFIFMKTLVCKICGSNFNVQDSRINKAKYCSIKCQHIGITGFKHSKETKEKLSNLWKGKFRNGYKIWNKGITMPQSMIDKIKGKIPWNKNKKMTEDFCNKIKKAKKGCYNNGIFKKGHKFYAGGEKGWFKKGHIPWSNNKKFSVEYRDKLSNAHIGKMIGEKHPGWKGGIINISGYIHIYSPTHPFAYNKYVKRANLVMEKHLGRYLDPKEIVHHKNKIRDDDRIENLVLFKNINEHMRFHRLNRN